MYYVSAEAETDNLPGLSQWNVHKTRCKHKGNKSILIISQRCPQRKWNIVLCFPMSSIFCHKKYTAQIQPIWLTCETDLWKANDWNSKRRQMYPRPWNWTSKKYSSTKTETLAWRGKQILASCLIIIGIMRDKLYLQGIIWCAEVYGRILMNLGNFPGSNKVHILFSKLETTYVLVQKHYRREGGI